MTFQIDKQRTKIGFSVKHMMITTVRGTFSDYNAQLSIDENDLSQSRVTAEVRTQSISTGDRLRDEYLVGRDFFNPVQFPSMYFQSSGVRLRQSSISVTGMLKIRDQERSLVLEGKYKKIGQDRLAFELAAEIDREAYGLVFNGAVETVSVVVGKKVKLDLSVELVRS